MKNPPQSCQMEKSHMNFIFSIHLPSSVVCSICTAQPSSGCPDLSGMDEDKSKNERFTQYRLPTPGCREACLHSEADTAIARGTQTHSVLWIRKAMISSADQAKTEEFLKVTNNLLHFFKLHPFNKRNY